MRFLSLTPFFAVPAFVVAGHQPNDVPPDPSYYDAPTAINRGHEAPLNAQKGQQDPWENGPLVKRWRQWVRRQDTESSETTETKSETQKTEESTTNEPTTTEEKTTTTEDKPTTTEEPTSTTEEPTTQETTTQEPSSTIESTSTDSSTSSTSTSSSNSITATEPGASCYSTTVSTTVVCSITTDGRTESASCITNRMTSSTCAPGLLCEIHPASGATVCMRKHEDIGTEGIVVAIIFGVCIAGCMAVLVGMCVRDKKREKKWQSIQRVRTLKQAKRHERTNLMAAATPVTP